MKKNNKLTEFNEFLNESFKNDVELKKIYDFLDIKYQIIEMLTYEKYDSKNIKLTQNKLRKIKLGIYMPNIVETNEILRMFNKKLEIVEV